MGRRLAVAASLLLLLIAVPIVLLEFAGVPTLDGIPDLEGIERAIELRWIPLEWAMQILALFAWGLWAYLAVIVFLRAAAALQARSGGDGKLWSLSEAVTPASLRLFVDLALGAVLLSSTVTHSSSAGARRSEHPSRWASAVGTQIAAVREARLDFTEDGQRHKSGEAARPRERVRKPRDERRAHRIDRPAYVVRPGDSLWSIAEVKLADPYRWPEIWKLNQGRVMLDGERLERPGFIRAGWRLYLPEECAGKDSRRPQETRAPRTKSPKVKDSDASGKELVPVDRPESPRPPSFEEPSQRVELPSGTAVTAAFVAGLVTGVAVVQVSRRRRRQPRPPSDRWPRPRAVARDLRCRLLRAMKRQEVGADEDIVHVLPGERDALQLGKSREAREVVLGHRDGQAVTAEPRDTPYLFRGSESDVASFFGDLAVHALVSSLEGLEVWIAGELHLPGVARTHSLTEGGRLLAELEIEVIRRRRMLGEESLEDWATHQQEWPDDPLPLVVAFFPEPPDRLLPRLNAVCAQGATLGMIVFASATDASANAIKDHVVTPVRNARSVLGEEPFDAIRLVEVDRAEALETLRSLAHVTGEEPVEPSPVTPPPMEPILETDEQQADPILASDLVVEPDDGEVSDRLKTVSAAGVAHDAAVPLVIELEEPAQEPERVKEAQEQPPPPATVEQSREGTATATRLPVEVRLFGPGQVFVAGEELRTGLGRKTRELLAFFLLHPEGATREQAIEALWPEVDPDRGLDRFWARLGELRTCLRSELAPSAKFIDRAGGDAYRVERELFDVDVWRFDELLASDDDSLGNLISAAELYRGELLEGISYTWSEQLRMHFQNRFMDAMVRLADGYQAEGALEEAVAALRRALAADPYSEELARRLMKLHARSNRPDAVRRQFEELETALDKIECEPSEETSELKDRLLKGARPDVTYGDAHHQART